MSSTHESTNGPDLGASVDGPVQGGGRGIERGHRVEIDLARLNKQHLARQIKAV